MQIIFKKYLISVKFDCFEALCPQNPLLFGGEIRAENFNSKQGIDISF